MLPPDLGYIRLFLFLPLGVHCNKTVYKTLLSYGQPIKTATVPIVKHTEKGQNYEYFSSTCRTSI